MKKAGRRFHRIFRAVFAAALALAITGANLAPAAAVTWADVNELKDEANGLDAEKKELQAKLDALADDKSQAVARKELLDQQIANTEAQIANTQAQIDRYAALITQTEAELVEAEEKEAAQYELFWQPGPRDGEAGRGQLLGGAVPGQQLYRPVGPAGRHQRDHEVRPGRHRRPPRPFRRRSRRRRPRWRAARLRPRPPRRSWSARRMS